jgi:hypothetical protein
LNNETSLGNCTSKLLQFAEHLCGFGWSRDTEQLAFTQSIAHLKCRVFEWMKSHDDHAMALAVSFPHARSLTRQRIEQAFVQREYWDGKRLQPRYPSYLTFLGTQSFAAVAELK